MRVLIMTVLMLVGNVSYGYPPSNTTSVRKNVFGGYNYYGNGQRLAQSKPNVFGGYDYYNGANRYNQSVKTNNGYNYNGRYSGYNARYKNGQ